MLSMMLIAATLAGSDPSPVTAARITAGTGNGTVATESAAASKEKRYCIKGTITGSRLTRQKCRTRAQWLQEGFDPTAEK